MDEALAAYRPESGAGAAGAENRESRNASIPARAGWSESPSGRWKAPERGAPLAKGANRGPPRAALSEAAGGFAGCRLWRMGGPRAGRLAGTDLPDLKVARQPRRPRTGHAPLLHQAMVEKSLEIWPGRSAGSPACGARPRNVLRSRCSTVMVYFVNAGGTSRLGGRNAPAASARAIQG